MTGAAGLRREPERDGGPAFADLTAFQRDVLRVLDHDDGRKGLSIKAELESYYGTPVNHGRLYPNLDQLVDRDLVDKGQRDRRTNEYALTETARDELARRDAWVTGGDA